MRTVRPIARAADFFPERELAVGTPNPAAATRVHLRRLLLGHRKGCCHCRYGPRRLGDHSCRRYEGRRTFDELFIIDESLPVYIARSLHPMPAEMAAVLDCWRNKIGAAVDEVVQRYKNYSPEDDTAPI